MRPKIVILLLAGATALLAALFWVRLRGVSPDSSASAAPVSANAPATAAASAPVAETAPARVLPAAEPAAMAGPTDEAEPVWKTQARLMELSSHDDPESLRIILGGLTSQDPATRKTALTATRQFGSRDAVPYLEEAVAHTDDPREKVAILDAIEFLKMPSLTELHETAQVSPGAPH